MHFPLFTVFLEEFLQNLLTFIQISRGNILDLRLISRFLYSLSNLLPAKCNCLLEVLSQQIDNQLDASDHSFKNPLSLFEANRISNQIP